MFDESLFDKEIDGLTRTGQEKKAEERMLTEHAKLKAGGNVQDIEYVAFRLAHYYSTPGSEDYEKAETYFLECEQLNPGGSSKRQTAWFYFYVLQSPLRTIAKVDEIEPYKTDRMSYYSALALKGQALIKLEMLRDAEGVLEEISRLIKTNPQGLPYGDEINLLEAAIPIPILLPRCREILHLSIPNIRSQEYQQKAKALLDSTIT